MLRLLSPLLLITAVSCQFITDSFFSELPSNPDQDPLFVLGVDGYVKGYYNHKLFRGGSRDLFQSNTSRAFTGIPYADPPTGKNRWLDPQPISKQWKRDGNKVYLATSDPPACPQKFKTTQNEDCLYLNVYTPPLERIKKLGGKVPVMFWLHGGAFVLGSNQQMNIYQGKYLAENADVIIVSPNYRIGVLGFLASETNQGPLTGNYGIKDQIAALKWVRSNIARFGGDPKRVTIFGQSAGATATLIHLVSPASEGLFQAVEVLSPPLGARTRTIKDVHAIGLEYAKNVSCIAQSTVDVDCLRQLPIEKIIEHQQSLFDTPQKASELEHYWPHADGTILPGDLLTLLEQGKVKKVPVIMGWMRDEAGQFTFNQHTPILNWFKSDYSKFELPAIRQNLATTYLDKAPLIEKHFGFNTNVEHNESLMVRVMTEYMFKCPIFHIAQKLAERNHPIYTYEFRKVQHVVKLGRCYKDLACHANELLFLWRPNWFIPTEQEAKVSKRMIDYFTGFVKGDINAKSQFKWPEFQPGARGQVMVFDDRSNLDSAQDYTKLCAFWNKQVGIKHYM